MSTDVAVSKSWARRFLSHIRAKFRCPVIIGTATRSLPGVPPCSTANCSNPAVVAEVGRVEINEFAVFQLDLKAHLGIARWVSVLFSGNERRRLQGGRAGLPQCLRLPASRGGLVMRRVNSCGSGNDRFKIASSVCISLFLSRFG